MRHTRLLPAIAATAVIATALLAGAAAAFAQLRSIPEDARRGQLRYVREMIVEIDGAQLRLSPGSQIRTTENRIVLPSGLPQEPLLVKYLVDGAGMVHRVWILTQEESARPDKKP